MGRQPRVPSSMLDVRLLGLMGLVRTTERKVGGEPGKGTQEKKTDSEEWLPTTEPVSCGGYLTVIS